MPNCSLQLKKKERKGGESGEKAVDAARRRCRALINRIQTLTKSPSSSWKTTLLRLVNSELSFLDRLNNSPSPPLSLNIGHLEAVFHILRHPSLTAVARVCKPIPKTHRRRGNSSVYVDVVCSVNGKPVWILVSDRNPKYNEFKELQSRIVEVLVAARVSHLTVRPSSLILSFSNGLRHDVLNKLRDEFCAVDFDGFGDFEEEEEEEGDWVYVLPCRSFERACVLEIKIESVNPSTERLDSEREVKCGNNAQNFEMDVDAVVNLGESFCSLVARLNSWSVGDVEDSSGLVNFDTTALVAVVSGISNGVTTKLLETPESDLRARFKGNYEFVINQVNSEITNPIHAGMADIISGKRGIVCESVFSEFQEIVSMCGGSREKLRAQHFLKQVKVVPDCPSERMMSLPTTRKMALKNKVAFGTGDHWHAPTITANMAFVRAVSQTGMSLFTVEHRPRALVGD